MLLLERYLRGIIDFWHLCVGFGYQPSTSSVIMKKWHTLGFIIKEDKTIQMGNYDKWYMRNL